MSILICCRQRQKEEMISVQNYQTALPEAEKWNPARIYAPKQAKNYANAPASAIIEETGVFTRKAGEKTHGMSQSS